ncbi:polymorphic outer membrane protein repeat-containing protein, partial [Sarcina sp. DSM 11001]|uniref:InlB B-repeat-containing protein n=1 Tax=Sarcina sp. DSM 11001 TaxID=1798184 RepID=UPI00088E4692
HVQLGTFVMNGGSIKNNSASENGGGLYATQNADITFTGGRIEQNTAEKGSVYLNSVGMKVSGDLYIESVYLTDPLITVTGPLTENSKIGLTYSNNAANNGKTLTSGLDRNGTPEHFFSAKNGYLTGLTPDGEIVMGTPVTVSFDSNGGSEVGPQTIAKNSIAAAPADPVYGRHIFKGWCLGSEAYDFSTPVADDLTLSAVWEEQYTITINADEGCTVTVMVSETDEDGTPIESGDTVPYGTVLQVSAVAKTGCRLTETPEPAYTVTGDLTISAKSEALKFTLTAAATEGGTEPAVSVENPVPYGTEVTVTASEPADTYEFIGWYQKGNNKRLTAEKAYTVTVTTDLALEARYQRAAGVVTFIKDSIVQKTVTAVSITQDDFPADPVPMYGYKFDGWDKTVEEINETLSSGGNITVNAKFIQLPASITVTIYNGESDTPETREYTESRWVTVTAAEVSGKTFSCWMMDDVILSYNRTASFRTETSCTVTAVYAVGAVETMGTALIRTGTYNESTDKLSFVAYLTVPEGAKISASGLVASSGDGDYDPSTELTLDNADYKKNSARAEGTGGPVTYTWTKTSVAIGDVWYARAYVRYTYNGESCTVYGDRVKVTAGCDYDFSEKAAAAIRTTSYNASTQKAVFVAFLTVPEGGVISKAGLVAAPGSTFDAADTLLTWDTASYKKTSTKAAGTAGPVSYTWTKTAVNIGDIWYVRPYVIYSDANGTEHTVYGELLKFTAE